MKTTTRTTKTAVAALPASASASVANREWTGASEETAAALPYVDDLGADWRPRVDQLVAEEMRRMPKRGKDYLESLAPAKALDLEAMALVREELARVERGESMPIPDTLRYRLDPPPQNKRSDVDAWGAAIDNARAQLEHQATRVTNLELGLKYAPAAWRARNAWAEATLKSYEEELARAKTAVNELNVQRKLQQEAAAKEFTQLEKEWYATTRKCFAIESAILDLEAQLATKNV